MNQGPPPLFAAVNLSQEQASVSLGTMKMHWLFRILAVLLVFVPPTLATVQAPLPGETTEARRRFCPGCYSVVISKPEMEPRIPSLEDLIEEGPIEGEPLKGTLRAPQPDSTRVPPRRPVRKPGIHLPGSFSPLSKDPRWDEEKLSWEDPVLLMERTTPRPLDSHKVALRIRREERKVVASMRRRGKQPGSRPVCRGCFSGLMLTGRPAEGIAEKPVPKSFSQSGEDSSGED